MVAPGFSAVKPKKSQGFMTLLSSAACEWFLIFMLFVDAVFSYLLTKFAQYCDLQTPCPLCSRIDPFFGKKKPGYYKSLLCSDHREEISSLVSCHNHGKLADVHAMCEDCIMSFVRSRKSASESYRLMVGKLGVDIEESGFKILLLNKTFVPDSSSPRTCSCCKRILRAKSNAQRLLQVTPVGFGASKANVKPPLPRMPGRSRFSRRESLKKLRDKISGPMAPRPGGNTGIDPLSHVGYTELKITSDSESEFPLSDDDEATSAFHGKNDYTTESYIQPSPQKLSKVVTDKSGQEKQINQTSEPLPSLLDQPVQLEPSELSDMNSLTPPAFVQHGLEELNWTHPHLKPNTSTFPELISLDDIPLSVENSKSDASIPQVSNVSKPSDLIQVNNILSSSNMMEIPDKSADVSGTRDTANILLAKPTTPTGFLDDKNPSLSNNMKSIDTLALSDKERRESGVLAESLSTTDSGKIENLKSLPRISSSHMDLSSKDASPRFHGHQRSDTAGSDAVDMIQMEAALERHDIGHESLDGITVKEIEGETVLDRLKRQVDYDQSCMKALFKELEEERSAAAVAANQAMAMITRLQEEKALLHMEALQYLRMMEEQAEYDMDALERANDLLAEKEKEMLDMEAELENYRDTILDEPGLDGASKEPSGSKGDSSIAEKYQVTFIENGPSANDDSISTNMSKGSYKPNQLSSMALNFDDEKVYMSQCLQKLEKKFHQLSRKGDPINLANGEYSEKMTNEVDNEQELPNDKGIQLHLKKGDNSWSMQKDLSASNGHAMKENSADSIEENNHLDVEQRKLSTYAGEIKLDTFESEITDLKARLEVLETDREILKHALNSLQNGNDGLQFIQEIAHQLQELRKIGFKKRCRSIP